MRFREYLRKPTFTVNAKKIVRIMTFSSYYAHTAPIFRDLEILTIDKLIVHRIGTVMYKFNYGLIPDVLNTMYRKNCEIHSYNTRSKDMFWISSSTQTSVLEFGILLW